MVSLMRPITLIIALMCAPMGARALPDAPIPKLAPKVWRAEVLALGALYSADLTLTARGLGSPCRPGCGRMVELDPLYGRHPSNARLALTGAGVFLSETLILHRTERSHRRWIKWAGRVGFAYTVAGEIQGIRSWVR